MGGIWCSCFVQTKNPARSSGSPKPKKRSRKRSEKRRYHIRNWADYNTALVQRGSLTLWLDADTLQNWHSHSRTGQRGKPLVYTDTAILCALQLGAVYQLPLRATQGLLASLVALSGVLVSVPNYTTLCRRRAKLRASVVVPAPSEPMHLVVDGTGLKVFGEGEWKVRQHGISKRRTWRKIHLGVDQKTGLIHAAATTSNSISDGEMLPRLLEQIPFSLTQVSADGGYDRRTCYDAIAQRQAKAVIPPRHGAKIWQHGNCRAPRLARDENVRRIRTVGRTRWKQESGYHRRSLVETTMLRLKTIFGDTLRARKESAQDTETLVRINALNKMTGLGMPQSYPI